MMVKWGVMFQVDRSRETGGARLLTVQFVGVSDKLLESSFFRLFVFLLSFFRSLLSLFTFLPDLCLFVFVYYIVCF